MLLYTRFNTYPDLNFTNWQTDYFRCEKRSLYLWFLYAFGFFAFELRARTGQTYEQNDGRARAVTGPTVGWPQQK